MYDFFLSENIRLLVNEADPREKVEWSTRYKVALGTAKGLLYLHEGCQRRIIHRDIKPANILLTEDFEPQVVYLETDVFSCLNRCFRVSSLLCVPGQCLVLHFLYRIMICIRVNIYLVALFYGSMNSLLKLCVFQVFDELVGVA